MASFTTAQLRNVALIGHSSSGKTTLAESMLYNTGATSRRGRVEDGTTVADWDDEAIRRRISVGAAVVPCEHKGHKINVLDTPGFIDFVGEIKGAVSVADAGIVLIDPVAGVEVGTELGWDYLNERNLPRIVFVNKMDRENAQFERVVNNLREVFSGTIVPVQIPIGEGSEFKGVVDLITVKAFLGEGTTASDVPGNLASEVEAARTQLVEAAAEGDDDLIMKYLEGEELTAEEINRGLKAGIANGKVIAVFCGSAVNNVGVRPFMDAILTFMPDPSVKEIVAMRPDDTEETLHADATGPLAAFVFKTVADPYVGKISYFRVFSGILRGDSRVYTLPSATEERVSQVFTPRGKEQLSVSEVVAGDIGVVNKLAATATNHTLCDRGHQLMVPAPVYPDPLYSLAVSPKTKADSAKMGPTLSRITEEDPTLQVRTEQGTGEVILSGMGEVHLDLAIRRMESKFGLGLSTAVPKVPYNESITRSAADYHRHKKQTGGAGQFGEVHMEIKPLERGAGFEFDTSRVFGGAISSSFFPSIEKGIRSRLERGPLAGYPVVDVRCEVYDGKMHPVDSKDIAFQIAGREVFKMCVQAAKPILLEPIYDVEIKCPEENMGDIMGDLNSRRGRIMGMESIGRFQVVKAKVPLAELHGYSSTLRSLTQGRANYTRKFSHYDPMPKEVEAKVIAEAQAEKAAAQ